MYVHSTGIGVIIQFRDQHPDIPWKDMAGMRDVVIHGYDNVNLRIVWDVITRDIPEIKPQIEQILADFEE